MSLDYYIYGAIIKQLIFKKNVLWIWMNFTMYLSYFVTAEQIIYTARTYLP